MEAAIRCAPDGPVLAIVNGAFSERFAHIARACERDTDVMDVPWGAVPDLGELARCLATRSYAAVTVVHSETSTGALTDVRAVHELSRGHGAMCLVDSVTGIAGSPLEFDAWGLDFALTGSQKALAMPPGLAFAAASPAFMAHAAKARSRGLYFDLVEFEQYAAKRQTPNTPALSLLYAAEAQLAHIVEETIEGRWARHAAMRAHTQSWVERVVDRGGPALGFLAREGERSATVSTLTLPPELPGEPIVRAVRDRGFVIGTGYGRLKSSTFRIGHMGDHTVETLSACLAAVESALGAGA
jgi:aspartate aminotransferase-like enzyme